MVTDPNLDVTENLNIDALNPNSERYNFNTQIGNLPTDRENEGMGSQMLKQRIQPNFDDEKPPYESEGSIVSKSAICKICLSEEEDSENDPLITPCSCSGTMKYMHLSCLKEWMKSKVRKVETDNCKTYVWENLF